jgi:hypothetical protein
MDMSRNGSCVLATHCQSVPSHPNSLNRENRQQCHRIQRAVDNKNQLGQTTKKLDNSLTQSFTSSGCDLNFSLLPVLAKECGQLKWSKVANLLSYVKDDIYYALNNIQGIYN